MHVNNSHFHKLSNIEIQHCSLVKREYLLSRRSEKLTIYSIVMPTAAI